jgi:hypothetical protein
LDFNKRILLLEMHGTNIKIKKLFSEFEQVTAVCTSLKQNLLACCSMLKKTLCVPEAAAHELI